MTSTPDPSWVSESPIEERVRETLRRYGYFVAADDWDLVVDIQGIFRAPERCHADNDGDCEWKDCPQLVERLDWCRLAITDDDD